mgnify:FL=1
MKYKTKYKKETPYEESQRIAYEILHHEKKTRAWLESPPKNWTSAILRAWYKDKPHLIENEENTTENN